MKHLSSNNRMQQTDDLFRSIRQVAVPEQLYEKITLNLPGSREVRVSRTAVRAIAAALVCMLVTETVVVLNAHASTNAVSSLVELPDNSLNYE